MKKLLTILLLIYSGMSVMAQYAISGRVLDASTRQVIDFANVSVCRVGETTPVDGQTTDNEGNFAITALPAGSYKVTVSFVGYLEYSRQVTLTQQDVSLGKIYLQEDTQTLQEVEVVGQNTTMRFELDKKIFSVDQNLAAAGGSVTDALEDIPSVEVDQEGNISLRNSENVEIWINGKPAGLDAESRGDILKQMPAESIKEIEVITNPGAKYSPEGTAGIINLVTKKDRKAGYYGSISANIDYALAKPWTTPPGGRIGANINFNKSIVEGYFNIGYHYHASNGGSKHDRYNFMASDTTRLIKDGQSHGKGGGMFMRAGLDLHITDRSVIGLTGFGMITVKDDKTNGFFSNRSDNPTLYCLYDVLSFTGPQSKINQENLIREYARDQKGSGYHPGGNAMIDWRFNINSEHKLSMSAQFNEFTWDNDHYYIQSEHDIHSHASTHQSVQEQLAENDNKSVQLKADYEWKASEKSRLEAGWQTDLAWRKTYSDAWNCTENTGYERLEQLTSVYNQFRTTEQTHALYVTYGNKFWNKFSMSLGLRGEYFKRHIESDYYGSAAETCTFKQDTSYFQLFPSAYLSYDFGHGNELQLNYTRRIDRPRGHQINPRQDISDSTNISYGNPNLLPQYSSSLELNYLKTWERHVLSAQLFYKFANDIIQNIKFVDGDIMRNTFVNLGKRHEAGLEVVAKNRLFGDLLQLTTSVSCYYNRINQAVYTPMLNGVPLQEVTIPEQNTIVGTVRLNMNFMFTKTFSGQISGRYRSPRVIAQGKTEHSYTIDLGLRKTFLDNTLALQFNVRDLLNTRARRSTIQGDGFWQYQENRWQSRTIGLGLTYNFGNMKPKYHEKQMDNSMSASDQFSDQGSDE